MHASPAALWSAPMPDADEHTIVKTYGGHDARLVAYGHIHRPYVRRLPALTVMNSGSVGLPYDVSERGGALPAHRLGKLLQSEIQRQGRFTRPS
jgi:predicted phosphodiesterase